MISKMFEEISQNRLVKKISIRIQKPEAKLPHQGGLAIVEAEWPFEQRIDTIDCINKAMGESVSRVFVPSVTEEDGATIGLGCFSSEKLHGRYCEHF